MLFNSCFSFSTAIHSDVEVKPEGFFQKASQVFSGPKYEDPLFPVFKRLEDVFNLRNMDNVIYLSFGGKTLVKNSGEGPICLKGIHRLIEKDNLHTGNAGEMILRLTMRKGNLAYYTSTHVKKKSPQRAEVSIEISAMTQIPYDIDYSNFQSEIKLLLSSGFIKRCEVEFREAIEGVTRIIGAIFKHNLDFSIQKRTIIPNLEDCASGRWIQEFAEKKGQTVFPPQYYRVVKKCRPYQTAGHSIDPFWALYWDEILEEIVAADDLAICSYMDTEGDWLMVKDAMDYLKEREALIEEVQDCVECMDNLDGTQTSEECKNTGITETCEQCTQVETDTDRDSCSGFTETVIPSFPGSDVAVPPKRETEPFFGTSSQQEGAPVVIETETPSGGGGFGGDSFDGGCDD